MVNWKHVVKMEPAWSKRKADEISIQELSKIVAQKLAALRLGNYRDEEFEDIVEQFKELAEEPDALVSDFDCILEQLYNWGDNGHRLWIDTFK